MSTFFFAIVGILLLSLVLLVIVIVLRRKLPLPQGNVHYVDTHSSPGEVIQSQILPLVGKPDYVLKKNGEFIPVEVKMGKTPQIPYKNHVAQLMAYCFLVEEQYEKRPSYGVLRYQEREFPLEYTAEAEAGIKKTVEEMLQKKQRGTYRVFSARVCKRCRDEKHQASMS